MLQTVLLPLDGSTLAETAVPWAVRLAQTRDLSITLARVVAWPRNVAAPIGAGYVSLEAYDEIVSAEREAAEAYLADVRDRLLPNEPEVVTVTREGTVDQVLLDLADELGAATIVMSTHGRSGFRRLLLGSVAERILHQATVPVLLVRAHEGQPATASELQRVLVPLDGSELAERAIDAALEIAPGAALVFVRGVMPVKEILPRDEGIAAFPDQKATDRAVDDAGRYLLELRRAFATAERPVLTEVRVGPAADEVVATARERKADLIVMVTHGRTGPSRWLLGSVADRVVRHAEGAVLLVSARALAARAIGPYQVRDLMTTDLATVRDDEPLIAALRKLLRRRVSGAPVVNAAGELVGVVSEQDLLVWQTRQIDAPTADAALAPADYARRLETDLVGQVMSRDVTSIEDTALLSAAERAFVTRGVSRLPVLRGGKLVGILTRSDVLKAMAAQWEGATAARELVPRA